MQEVNNNFILSPSKDQRNKWTKEDLLVLDNIGQRMIDCDSVEDRLIMLFDNFTIRECSISSKEETNFVELKDMMRYKDDCDTSTAFAMDKELGLIAVGSESGVNLFDY